MKNVVEKLKNYKERIIIKDKFTYSFDFSSPIFTELERNLISSAENAFEQNIKLKNLLSEKYKTTNNHNEIDFWIINSWGGIRGFKNIQKNKDKINNFKNQINEEKLTLEMFETISSLSKISSFINPEKFSIYDSRVVYTLNWLILTCENKEKLNFKYFPIPTSRNKILQDFDLNTILNLFHFNEYEKGNKIYLDKQKAYFEYCKFINCNVEEIFGKGAKPYELEMLLFLLADNDVFKEITQKIKINNNFF